MQPQFCGRNCCVKCGGICKYPVKSHVGEAEFLQEHLYPGFRGNAATRYGKDNELMSSRWLWKTVDTLRTTEALLSGLKSHGYQQALTDCWRSSVLSCGRAVIRWMMSSMGKPAM
ncbi:hypothetical protein J4Q44_G00325840 [Coregonus suidteri]|uniref:Uncharacterized protein n=1 Tax=Coregonus suidteri TaxID=861788 RepID=A0AAN8KS91_9TELE